MNPYLKKTKSITKSNKSYSITETSTLNSLLVIT